MLQTYLDLIDHPLQIEETCTVCWAVQKKQQGRGTKEGEELMMYPCVLFEFETKHPAEYSRLPVQQRNMRSVSKCKLWEQEYLNGDLGTQDFPKSPS